MVLCPVGGIVDFHVIERQGSAVDGQKQGPLRGHGGVPLSPSDPGVHLPGTFHADGPSTGGGHLEGQDGVQHGVQHEKK